MAVAASRGTTTPQSKTAQTQELQVAKLRMKDEAGLKALQSRFQKDTGSNVTTRPAKAKAAKTRAIARFRGSPRLLHLLFANEPNVQMSDIWSSL